MKPPTHVEDSDEACHQKKRCLATDVPKVTAAHNGGHRPQPVKKRCADPALLKAPVGAKVHGHPVKVERAADLSRPHQQAARQLLRRLSSSLSAAPGETRAMLRNLSGRFTGLLASHRQLSIGSDDIDRHEFGAPGSCLLHVATPAGCMHAPVPRQPLWDACMHACDVALHVQVMSLSHAHGRHACMGCSAGAEAQ